MSYVEALEKLAQLGPELRTQARTDAPDKQLPTRKFSLDWVRTLLSALGSPQNAYPCVLIAGTNGKGSTSATLAAIAAASALRVGLYTSPHLFAGE